MIDGPLKNTKAKACTGAYYMFCRDSFCHEEGGRVRSRYVLKGEGCGMGNVRRFEVRTNLIRGDVERMMAIVQRSLWVLLYTRSEL